jgi:predicted RNA-binding protein with PUA-like domain
VEPRGMPYWLMKSEPGEVSVDDLMVPDHLLGVS